MAAAKVFLFLISTTLSLVVLPTVADALATDSAPTAAAVLNISAVFAFGDSTLDPGNNNAIPTLVRANHPPYGCDFPGQVATGRFSDGQLITDYLASYMGVGDRLPAYLDPSLRDDDLLAGVSFASAGSGLDDLTATTVGVMTVGQQVAKFKEYIGRLQQSVGKEEATQKLAGALFVIGAGGNDMMMNYYMSPSRRSMGLSGYHNFLLQRVQSLVQQLYSMGGRIFTVSGLPPIGCVPFAITASSGPGNQRACVDQQNTDSMEYNSKLQNMLRGLKTSLSGSKMAYVDIYTPLMDMIKNPKQYGFTETNRGCCGTGLSEMGPMCMSIPPHCPDPSKFLFWDSVHPSQAAYEALSIELMKTVIPQL
uniref:GDSL esterase/lipase At1g06990 n=1 Tax=Anthurium amnicola TaxID=1678845 RepID=A0A1D1YI19_9ARAE